MNIKIKTMSRSLRKKIRLGFWYSDDDGVNAGNILALTQAKVALFRHVGGAIG